MYNIRTCNGYATYRNRRLDLPSFSFRYEFIFRKVITKYAIIRLLFEKYEKKKMKSEKNTSKKDFL